MTQPRDEPDTEQLLDRVVGGDPAARAALLLRHRDRLRQMVALRLDPRLRARMDPSDVVQEGLVEADRKLADYARQRPLPFYPWLRQITWQHLVKQHRRHARVRRRSVYREEPAGVGLPDSSAMLLAGRLARRPPTPSGRLRHEEALQRVKAGLQRLSEPDREVLVLRCLEDLSTREVAAVLGVTESAVRMRQLRAVQRLRALLGDEWEGR